MPRKYTHESLVGNQYGQLTVLKENGKNEKGQIQWLCKCTCGNNKLILGNNLKNGKTNSCGCFRKRGFTVSPSLVGQIFGRLTVIKELPKEYKKLRKYICECTCGNKNFEISARHLITENTTSCGCKITERKLRIKLKDVFNRLTVIRKLTKNKYGHVRWLCKCECGNKVKTTSRSLVSRNTQSCGCLKLDIITKHGHATKNRTNTYCIWSSMKDRCYNSNNKNYHRYGGRGIKICKRWRNKENGFNNFLTDMGAKPKGLSIDRIDNNGNYTPKNCRWATPLEQAANKNKHLIVKYKGRKIRLADLCRLKNFNYSIVFNRRKRGWPKKRWFEPAL